MQVTTLLKQLHEKALITALRTPYKIEASSANRWCEQVKEPALLSGIGEKLSFLAALDSNPSNQSRYEHNVSSNFFDRGQVDSHDPTKQLQIEPYHNEYSKDPRPKILWNKDHLKSVRDFVVEILKEEQPNLMNSDMSLARGVQKFYERLGVFGYVSGLTYSDKLLERGKPPEFIRTMTQIAQESHSPYQFLCRYAFNLNKIAEGGLTAVDMETQSWNFEE
ncbi:MAG: hypothetical protein SFU25_07025 [Candidatus Caenarcaniphilales bacterium]|nr:hypothetical protein [Candidatus Caenarcaniphilales bacterium]